VGRRADGSALAPGPGRELVDLLRRLRLAKPLSNTQIAVKSSLSRSYVSEILSGTKNPSPDAAAKVAAALGADDALIERVRTLAEAAAELADFQRQQAHASGAGTDRHPDKRPGPAAGSIIQSGSGTNAANTGIIVGDFTVGGHLP